MCAVLACLIGAEAMTTVGFDCGAHPFNRVEMKTYSLLDVHACSIKRPIVETRRFTGQIIQTKLYEFREIFQCKVKVKRNIRRCSWFGYLEPVENGHMEFLLDLTRDQCKKMHETRSFSYDSQHILTDLKLNQTTVRAMSLAGNAIDNSCNVGTYSDRFGTWNSVIVEGLITITLANYIAKVDIKNNKILLRSGLGCEYSETECLDVHNGYSFWENLQKEDCVENKVEVIYEGVMEAVTETRNNVSTLHYFVAHKDILATLKYNGIHDICHIKFIKTEFTNLYIIEEKENFIRSRNIVPDLFTYINAKFVHVEGRTREQMSELYLDILNKKCESDMAILREKLSLAYLSPDSFAYDLMGPGYMAHLSGELIHIVKCVAVEIEIRDNLETCYNEIPIIYKEKEMFLSHKTKIIVQHGTERKCNKILSVGFKIDDTWIIFTPKLTVINAPEMLSPEMTDVWNPTEITNLATGGIYSEEDMKNYMRQIMFPMDRRAILDNTASTISEVEEGEKQDSQKNIYSVFEFNYWKTLARKYWRKFEKFGNISAGIIMLFIIFYFSKETINIFIRGFTLHKAFGFSIKILAAIFGSLTHLILVPQKGMPRGERQQDLEMEAIELESVIVEKPKNLNKSKIPKRKNNPNFTIYSSPFQLNDNPKRQREYLEVIPTPAPRNNLNTKETVREKIQTQVIIESMEEPVEIKSPLEYDHYSC